MPNTRSTRRQRLCGARARCSASQSVSPLATIIVSTPLYYTLPLADTGARRSEHGHGPANGIVTAHCVRPFPPCSCARPRPGTAPA